MNADTITVNKQELNDLIVEAVSKMDTCYLIEHNDWGDHFIIRKDLNKILDYIFSSDRG